MENFSLKSSFISSITTIVNHLYLIIFLTNKQVIVFLKKYYNTRGLPVSYQKKLGYNIKTNNFTVTTLCWVLLLTEKITGSTKDSTVIKVTFDYDHIIKLRIISTSTIY